MDNNLQGMCYSMVSQRVAHQQTDGYLFADKQLLTSRENL